jgi:ATP-dependent DNA helicase 2 subunit 2
MCIGGVDIFIAEPGNIKAGAAFSALVRAMQQVNKVAIIRYVKRKNAAPELGFLFPKTSKLVDCCYYNRLPFAEDVRRYVFPSLSVAAKMPSQKQLAAVQVLIDSMDLMTAQVDLDGSPNEALKPGQTFNPALQRFYQCVQARALMPDAGVEELV